MAEAKAKIKFSLGNVIVPKNSKITITHGRNEKYAIWNNSAGIYDLPSEYIKEIDVKVNI